MGEENGDDNSSVDEETKRLWRQEELAWEAMCQKELQELKELREQEARLKAREKAARVAERQRLHQQWLEIRHRTLKMKR